MYKKIIESANYIDEVMQLAMLYPIQLNDIDYNAKATKVIESWLMRKNTTISNDIVDYVRADFDYYNAKAVTA